MIQMAINAPAAAESHGSSRTGASLYPATTKIAVNISRINDDIGPHNEGILPRQYRHRHGKPLQLDPFKRLNEQHAKVSSSDLHLFRVRREPSGVGGVAEK